MKEKKREKEVAAVSKELIENSKELFNDDE